MATSGKIKIHDDKIDIHKKQDRFQQAMLSPEQDSSTEPENKMQILRFLRDCKLGKTVLGKSKKNLSLDTSISYRSNAAASR